MRLRLRHARLLLTLVACTATADAKLVRSNLKPFRGWTSWDLSALKDHPPYGKEWLNEANVLAQSAALASTGLQANGGFDHLNIDSFWSFDPTKRVDEYGRWAANTTRFPRGMRAVADAVHARGQKFGREPPPAAASAAAHCPPAADPAADSPYQST